LKDPGKLPHRSDDIDGYENTGTLYEWKKGNAYLTIDSVRFKGKNGAILYYHNPPVHQIGTTALYAFHEGLDRVVGELGKLDYFIVYGTNDPVHSGGDLKESLEKLERSLRAKAELILKAAPAEDVDSLFRWGEERLQKGIVLYDKIRCIARQARVVGVCGGGLRFGGSAEIQLMCDVLVGDSRSGMCFSEAMIGIIPGWGGMARVLSKAGLENAEYMTKTARVVEAKQLKEIGIYNDVVTVDFPFPQKRKGNSHNYQMRLEEHDSKTALLMLPRALALATCEKDEIPAVSAAHRKILASREEISEEVEKRMNPDHYVNIRNQRLKDVQAEISLLGRPLAPQSIAAVDGLLNALEFSTYNEAHFIHEELKADAALYRDPKFMVGLTAMLEQRVPDFREPKP